MSSSMKKAFTMIEIIIVILVIGIIYVMAKMSMPDGKFYSDVNFITQKIKQKQLYAIGYDSFDFNNGRDSAFNDLVCIDIDIATINDNENSSSSQKKYQIDPQTIISINSGDQKICFDFLGRVYKNNLQLNNLVKVPIEFNITNKNRTKELLIMPISGYIMQKE